MIEVMLIRPGSTTFDEEGRIKGALDIPLSLQGEAQSAALAEELASQQLDCLYVAPCDSAAQSASKISKLNGCRTKVLECLRNVDHGLWQGKLVADVKRCQPKVYRQFQEHPTDVCPPEGETVKEAYERITSAIERIRRKHRGGRIGMLVPQPMNAVVRVALVGGSLGDLWQSELDFGTFEVLKVSADTAAPVSELSSLPS
ncbi:MAG TPA: histidine phosphatase family protein [Planctomycetaceae bacterium]|nr:histidine phosphatase family protein [Planctomycetaceae bacterium]